MGGKLLIKKISLILLIGMFLWVGIACAPRPLRDTGTIKWAQIQSQDRSKIRSDPGAGQKSPSDSPLPETSKQAIAPHRTAPAPAKTRDKPPVVKPEPARPQLPPAQQRYPDIAPGTAPAQHPDGASGTKAPSPLQGVPSDFPQAYPADPPASRGGQFTLNFDDADIYAVIQTVFGEILKVNYVVDPRVKGRVTFRAIAPIPAEKVLPLMEVILRLNGIGMVEESSLYRIVPINDISKEPSPVSYGRDPQKIQTTGKALLQVVPILHVKSSEALKLITPFASNNAVLIDVPKGNQIILVDTDANIKRLLKLIEIFDNENLNQRKPQLYVYRVQNGKAKNIASLLKQIFKGDKGDMTMHAPSTGGTVQAGTPVSIPAQEGIVSYSPSRHSTIPAGDSFIVSETVSIIADEITNTIVVLSTPEDYTIIAKAIEQIDIFPRQVIIESIIASVSLDDNLSLGLAAILKGSVSGYGTDTGLNTNLLTPKALAQAGFTFLVTDTAGIVRGLLTALASETKAKVLAAPHILVSDNTDARIQVGQQVPLLASETYGVVGVAPQRNYSYKDIGIILKVKPRINEGGLVSLEITQEISTYKTLVLGGADQLLINKTDVSTSLVVQDGQTIVIGGLIREDITKVASGLPFLSRIPFFGWLFGGTEDTTSRQEIIILLTPRVIKNQKDARDLSGERINNTIESSQGGIRQEELIRERPPRDREDVKPPDASEKSNLPRP